MIPDWITALVALGALALSVYNVYTQRRDRTPLIDMAVVWNLPSSVPQASKGPGQPATAPPGEAIFQCEITNVGRAGVKIKEVHFWVDEPPGKPKPMHLSEEEPPRKLDNGDSQMWLSWSYKCGPTGNVPMWTHVMALDTVGRTYVARNPGNIIPISRYSSGPIQPTS